MSDGDFPFQSFTLRTEGYDESEVDAYVAQLRGEIVELRRALDTATHASEDDARLHDPEGAVTRTLAIAQETADRVLHDAQVEADRRRIYADEQANSTIREAENRASTMLAEIEAQATEVREQGIAAARSAIKVERDKAMAELSQVRRVRDDLRDEAADLKSALDRYRIQAREASDVLASAATGPLNAVDLPDFVDDEVALAGVGVAGYGETLVPDDGYLQSVQTGAIDDGVDEVRFADDVRTPETRYEVVEDDDIVIDSVFDAHESDVSTGMADVIAFDTDTPDISPDVVAPAGLVGLVAADDLASAPAPGGGAFLSEVRAAAEDDSDESDRFLSELRGATDSDTDVDETADAFFSDPE